MAKYTEEQSSTLTELLGCSGTSQQAFGHQGKERKKVRTKARQKERPCSKSAVTSLRLPQCVAHGWLINWVGDVSHCAITCCWYVTKHMLGVRSAAYWQREAWGEAWPADNQASMTFFCTRPHLIIKGNSLFYLFPQSNIYTSVSISKLRTLREHTEEPLRTRKVSL